MEGLLAGVTVALLGFLAMIGIGVMGFGVWCALTTQPQKHAGWDAHVWIWIGRVTIACGLLLMMMQLGHFVMWAAK